MLNELTLKEKEELAVKIIEVATRKYGKHTNNQLVDLVRFCLPLLPIENVEQIAAKYSN